MNRTIKFRAWSAKENYWLAVGFHIIGETTLFDLLNQHRIEELDSILIQEFTGLYDKNGIEIYEGDRIRFFRSSNDPEKKGIMTSQGIWDGTVIFEDGVFTVDRFDAKLFENPVGWDQPHEWIRSRSWACQVGYGEFGDWNVPRKALVEIQNNFLDFELDYKPIAEKIGWEKRFLNVEVIGNIFENKGLLAYEL